MTAVHIRYDFEAKATYLADVPFDELDTVIPTIKVWSVHGEDLEMSAQFVIDDASAYFEVVLHEATA